MAHPLIQSGLARSQREKSDRPDAGSETVGAGDDPIISEPTPPATAEDFSPEKSWHVTWGAFSPLYAAGASILLLIAVTSPILYEPPQSWYRLAASVVVLSVIVMAWRYSRNRLLSSPRNDLVQFLVMLAATGFCVVTQWWNNSVELSQGFVVVPLMLAVMFRTFQASLAMNVIVAGAWTLTWYSSDLPFTSTALLDHLVYVPTLSIALSITQRGVLRELAAFHVNQRQSLQQRHDAMRRVAVEASLRAKSEAELRRQHALLESILATVPDEIFVKDRERRLILANRAWLQRTKLTLEEVLGRNTDGLLSCNLAELSRQTDDAVLREGIHVHRVTTAVYEDGGERIYELEKLPLMEDGQITGVVGIARDITERKEAERRLKEQELLLLHASRLSSMGELVAGIAHEVNQPLYSILNYSKAIKNLLDGLPNAELSDVRNWNDQILKEAARGGKITKRLRSFVRRAESQREESSLTAIVRESIDFIAAEARRAHVQIECCSSSKLPRVLVDRVQIQQVLVNLLKNAIEALANQPSDSRLIVASIRPVSEGLELAVADNGPGIPPHEAHQLFEPFFTTKREGIGLGLAISNSILRAHDSKLDFQTNDWGGATFYFTLKSQA
jgi:two-component system sensor kinase FixL